MKPAQIATGAMMAILAGTGEGCELVLGDLPTPREDLQTTASAGGGSTAPGVGGNAGGDDRTTSAGMSSTGGGGERSTGSSGQGGCCGECDCDCDGFPAEGVCAGTGTADCDDTTDEVYPGEPTYHEEMSPNNGFDWDCSGEPVRDPDLDVSVDCGSLLGIGCDRKTGFLGKTVPTCGEPADWGTCKKVGLECIPDVIESGKKMACK